MNYQITGNEYISLPTFRESDGAAEGGVRAVARGAGGEHSPPWFIGDSSLAQIRWSLQGRRLQ